MKPSKHPLTFYRDREETTLPYTREYILTINEDSYIEDNPDECEEEALFKLASFGLMRLFKTIYPEYSFEMKTVVTLKDKKLQNEKTRDI